MVGSLRRRVAPVVIAVILAMVAIIAQAILTTTHFNDAEASSFTCAHASQGIHEIPAPASWPGTRAAHIVDTYGNSHQQIVYTKSGWWDPTWDYYYASTKTCV
jgi:hypothetical protein